MKINSFTAPHRAINRSWRWIKPWFSAICLNWLLINAHVEATTVCQCYQVFMSTAHIHFAPSPCWVLMLTCQGECIRVTYAGSFWAASYVMAICCRSCDFYNRWRDTTTPTLPAFCCSMLTGPSVTQNPSSSELASRYLYWNPSMQHSMNSMLFWVRVPVLSVKTYSTCRKCHKNIWQTLPKPLKRKSVAHLTGSNNKMRPLRAERITPH